MKIIILAAGMGTRLGNSLPKTMTTLANNKTILENQIDNLKTFYDIHDIMVVVGYKKEIIMEAHPELLYVYNEKFNCTNTAYSLLLALEKVKQEDALWLNGDVFFDASLVQNVKKENRSLVFVNSEKVGKEEIKYKTNRVGMITAISKTIDSGLGEAIGINYITGFDLPLLKQGLKKCGDKDYFEKGIEIAISNDLKIFPFNIQSQFCTEIDFKEDLSKVNKYILSQEHSTG